MAPTGSVGNHKTFSQEASPRPPRARGQHMRLAALRASFDFFHSTRLNLVAAVAIALAAYWCAQRIIDADLSALYYAGLVVLGIVALVAIFRSWRTGLYCFLAWIMVEDLIR